MDKPNNDRWHPGTWVHPKRKRPLVGKWIYNYGDTFTIVLDSVDPITGKLRTINTSNDKPEWDKWTLVKAS